MKSDYAGNSVRNDRTMVVRVLALLGGVFFMTFCLRTPGIRDGEPLQFFLLSLVILVPLTSVLSARSERYPWAIAQLILVGIVVGTMIDVVLDTKEDRNLFPLEIVLDCATVTPAIVAGSLLGWFLKNRTSKTTSPTDRESHSQRESRGTGISASTNDATSAIKLWTTRLLVVVAGAAYVIVCNQTAGLPYLYRFPRLFIVLVFAILFLITLVVTAFSRYRLVRFTNLCFLIGVAAGVIVLFVSVPKMYIGLVPTKIALWWLISAPALVSGSALGAWLRSNRETNGRVASAT
jgi:hypothetical protein